MSDALGVIKHDSPTPANMAGREKGSFPGYLPKTDEIRLQVLEKVLAQHHCKTFNVTVPVER